MSNRYGTFHEYRFLISEELSHRLRTGDILCRQGNAKFYGIPFSKLISWATQSKFSHASIAVVNPDQTVDVVEVNEFGTMRLRLIDWISWCYGNEIRALRHIDMNYKIKEQLLIKANEFWKQDPDFDYGFNKDNEFYCVESVVHIFESVGLSLGKPSLIMDVVNPWVFAIASPINAIIKKLTGAGLDITKPLYFVGNEKYGILASKKLYGISRYIY